MITEHSSRQADKKIKNREKLHAPHLEKGKRITWEFNSQDFNFLLFLFPPTSTPVALPSCVTKGMGTMHLTVACQLCYDPLLMDDWMVP